MVAGVLFCVCLIVSNILETKVFHFFGPFTLTCGVLIFPLSYIINDCISEVWGLAKARFVIWMGFIVNALVMVVCGLTCLIPPLNPGDDEAFRSLFTFAPQIVVASLLAFLAGSMLNARVMCKMKVADGDKGRYGYYFSLRAIVSTLIGETVDSLVYFPLAFCLFPIIVSGKAAVSFDVLLSLMFTQVAFKTLYEILILPITLRVVKHVRRIEASGGGE